MAERFDVIVVGARCAGSPLALLLARQGLRVGVVERAKFPRDTLSTHIFQGPSIKFLDRLGVLDAVRATGAPSITRVDGRTEDFRYTIRVNQRLGDQGAFMSVRRMVLDPILAGAAAEAGADVLMGANVTGLVHEAGRVAGVRVAHGGGESVFHARVVVGADGRNSTVASLAGARKYNVVPSERLIYWSFFKGADVGPDPELFLHRWEGQFVIACPADSGLFEAIALPDPSLLASLRADLEGTYLSCIRACRPLTERLAGAKRVGKVFGIVRFEGFFREASGPGWVLAGDAGCFKDPAPGAGISDAFRQAEALAPVIAGAIGGGDEELDAALAGWGRWRDRDHAEHYWLAQDFGQAGPSPVVFAEILRRLDRRGRLPEIAEVLQHRRSPSEVITPPRLLGAVGSLLARPGVDRGRVLREVRELVALDARRHKLNRKPEFVPLELHADAGDTEVRQLVAV